MKAIDRQAIANIRQRGLVDNPTPLNNHIYVAGQEGYQNNSGVAAFNPDQARRDLDDLGWTLNGPFRQKDGRLLTIRLVLFDALRNRQIAQVAQNSLAQVGVELDDRREVRRQLLHELHHPGGFRHRAVRLGR